MLNRRFGLSESRKLKSFGYSAVLVAVEGEGSDDDAVKLACDLLGSTSSTLYIVYIIEVDRGLPLDVEAEIAPATAKGEEILKDMEEVAKPHKLNVQAELLLSRRAGSAVVQEAVDKQVDAIVLAVPYQQQYGLFSIGDTADYVLKTAPCRVILWRNFIEGQQSLNNHE